MENAIRKALLPTYQTKIIEYDDVSTIFSTTPNNRLRYSKLMRQNLKLQSLFLWEKRRYALAFGKLYTVATTVFDTI